MERNFYIIRSWGDFARSEYKKNLNDIAEGKIYEIGVICSPPFCLEGLFALGDIIPSLKDDVYSIERGLILFNKEFDKEGNYANCMFASYNPSDSNGWYKNNGWHIALRLSEHFGDDRKKTIESWFNNLVSQQGMYAA